MEVLIYAGSTPESSMPCEQGEDKAYVLGDESYGAAADQCSELCASSMALAWMPAAVKGTCASAGFSEPVEQKMIQQDGSPVKMEVLIHGSGSNANADCHCHSYEEIKCDASGDALYDEHIVEIENECQGIVDGSETVCPYKCFQPFEVLHLHYLECDYRAQNALYKQIE